MDFSFLSNPKSTMKIDGVMLKNRKEVFVNLMFDAIISIDYTLIDRCLD